MSRVPTDLMRLKWLREGPLKLTAECPGEDLNPLKHVTSAASTCHCRQLRVALAVKPLVYLKDSPGNLLLEF